ncbi:hypothetical protein [Streptomyces sp. NPDC004435]|uniref:hypothetical protein n=1 Tax=Streptomyces sp. NPDC004435 TaxID=3364701 RepID=UPI00368B3D42
MDDLWNHLDEADCGIDGNVVRAEQFAAEFRAVLTDLVWRETKRRMLLAEGGHPHSPNAIAPGEDAKNVHLEYVQVACEAGDLMRRLAAEGAARAGRSGASYAELGSYALGITRQAARKRWPGVVGKRWTLYTITGSTSPHGRATQIFTSFGKAIDHIQGVMGSVPNEETPVAAVLFDSSRQVAWCGVHNDATWGVDEVELPWDLWTVPSPDSPAHAEWHDQWERHVLPLRT